MNINRNNYEEYFVLYIDNELNASEKKMVEEFVQDNPDLRTELEMFQQTILPAEDKPAAFNKELLFRSDAASAAPAGPMINPANREEYFVQYGDNELNVDGNAMVEDFVYRNPQFQEEFELIQQVKYSPEKHIVFPDKSVLYRTERKVVPLFPVKRIWKMAAAAAVILMIGGTAWYSLNSGSDTLNTGSVAVNEPGKNNSKNNTAVTKGIDDSLERQIIADDNPEAKNLASADNKKPSTTEQAAGQAALNANSHVNNPAVPNQLLAAKTVAQRAGTNENIIQADKSLAQNIQKKVSGSSNIPSALTVQQERNIDTKKEEAGKSVPVVENPVIDESLAFNSNDVKSEAKVAIGPVELPENNVFARMANDNDEEFETSDRKNRARGFFRKVTRVFDKAVSKEPLESRKGIHIASFAIGLK